jgi:hypothetical protein
MPCLFGSTPASYHVDCSAHRAGRGRSERALSTWPDPIRPRQDAHAIARGRPHPGRTRTGRRPTPTVRRAPHCELAHVLIVLNMCAGLAVLVATTARPFPNHRRARINSVAEVTIQWLCLC